MGDRVCVSGGAGWLVAACGRPGSVRAHGAGVGHGGRAALRPVWRLLPRACFVGVPPRRVFSMCP